MTVGEGVNGRRCKSMFTEVSVDLPSKFTVHVIVGVSLTVSSIVTGFVATSNGAKQIMNNTCAVSIFFQRRAVGERLAMFGGRCKKNLIYL
jgi:hypothetical protein